MAWDERHELTSAGLARCSYGALDVDPQRRVQRTGRQRKQTTHDVERVQEVQEGEAKKSESDTTRHVKRVYDLLERMGPINMFEFFINPESFSQSVENLFYLSFLIRDGKAYIDDENGEPMLGK